MDSIDDLTRGLTNLLGQIPIEERSIVPERQLITPDNSGNMDRRDFLSKAGLVGVGAFTGLASLATLVSGCSWFSDDDPSESPDWQVLRKEIKDYTKRQRGNSMLDDLQEEEISWLLYDITTEQELVAINTDVARLTASMIKPFVALAFFDQSPNALRYDDIAKSAMERMLVRSSNGSYNWLVNQLKGPEVTNNLLRSKYSKIFKELELVEYIPIAEEIAGQTYRNRASPNDYRRFLEQLYNHRLPNSDKILRFMKNHNRSWITNDVASNTKVYDKTGSTGKSMGNMGLFVGEDQEGVEKPYIIVGVIERTRRVPDADYGLWVHNRGIVLSSVAAMMHRVMKERYELQ